MRLNVASGNSIELEGERRQVTALFYDIVGSTALLVSSDPEDYSRKLRDFHKKSEKIIRHFGGHIQQKLGDGGCSYFGYPLQMEDAAEKAIHAALELVSKFSKKRNGEKQTLKLRIGVATGVVIISSDSAEIIGTAPVLAARLQAEALENSVLVADSTYQLTQGKFNYQFVKNSTLKGFADPVPIWRPVGPIRMETVPLTAAPPGTPLHGRSAELKLLRTAWRNARKSNGQSLAILGESGIGKSRLVFELRHEIALSRDGSEYLLQCQQRLSGRPLHSFFNFLNAIVGAHSLEKRDHLALREALHSKGIAVSEGAAQVLSEFATEKPQQNSGYIKVADISGRQSRSEVIAAATEVLSAAATLRPMLMVFEDIHWADSMTMELIASMISRTRQLPVLIVVIGRGQAADLETLSLGSSAVKLSSLDAPSTSTLVESIWGKKLPPDLASFVFEKSDGVPLFAEELTIFLQRHTSADNDTLAGWKRLLRENGVATLNDLLSARLADAGPGRRTAQIASVIGREFYLPLLARLLDMEQSRVADELNELVSLGILEKDDDGDHFYRFRHALLQEAAYASLLRRDCRIIHKQICKILLTGDTVGIPNEEASWHCSQGGFPVEAARFATLAAEASVIRCAMREADQLLNMAEEQLALTPRGQKRTELQLDVLELRGVVSVALQGEGAPEARNAYERALTIFRKRRVRNAGERFALYWGWWFTAPDLIAQQKRARVLVKDLSQAEEPEIRLQSLHCGWATGFHSAQHEFCLQCVSRGLALYDPDSAKRSRAYYGGHDAKVCGLGERALSLALMGDAAGSEAAMAECLRWADHIGHTGSILHALYYAVVLRRCQGRHEEVLSLASRMSILAREHEMAASLARASMFGGWAELMLGSPDVGMTQFQVGLDLQRKIGTEDNESIQIDMQSEVFEQIGRRVESLNLIGSAITRSENTGQRFWLAELHRRRANILFALGESRPLIRRELERAIQIGRSQSAQWLVDRATEDLLRMGDLSNKL